MTGLQPCVEESNRCVKGFVFQGQNELISIYTNINAQYFWFEFKFEAMAAGKFDTGG